MKSCMKNRLSYIVAVVGILVIILAIFMLETEAVYAATCVVPVVVSGHINNFGRWLLIILAAGAVIGLSGKE